MHNSTSVSVSVPTEPENIVERFRKAQAEYRSQAILSPSEWPMHTAAGRKMYQASASRDRFLSSLADLDESQVRFCVKCGHADVSHGQKGCKAGSCLCWMNREAMRFEKNLESIAGGAN